MDLSTFFANPALAMSGAALVASPIIIHLINRLRYRRVRFAAMEFLLQSQQRNRRRILLEQLLLLFLRCAIVLGLVALVARLILDTNQLAMLRGTESHHLVLIDDSGSMQDRVGDATAFDEALEIVRGLVERHSKESAPHKFTLALLSNPHNAIFRQERVDEEFLQKLETKLKSLPCSHRRLELKPGLDAAAEAFADEEDAIKSLYVISDFRAADWKNASATADTVQALDAAGVSLNFVKVVPERSENLAVTELVGDLHVAARGVPLPLKVTVTNFGTAVRRNVRLAVILDGKPVLGKVIRFEKVEAGASESATFHLTFQEAGRHRLQMNLEGDSFPADDTRYLAIDIPDRNKVLLVDGSPSGDEAEFVAYALAASPDVTGFQTTIADVEYLRRNPLDEFQCVYMINVPRLPADAVSPLEGFVESGGGLAWFTGPGIDADYYNTELYDGAKGLFPVPLAADSRELPPDPRETPPADVEFLSHPMFDILFRDQEANIASILKVHRYHPVSDEPLPGTDQRWNRSDNVRKDGVTTIARLRNGQPLMFEHRLGEGRVITCLTTAGLEWNNWAASTSAGAFVPLQLNLEKHIARSDRGLTLRTVGVPVLEVLDPARYSQRLEIVRVDASGERSMAFDASIETGASADDAREKEATGNPSEAPPLTKGGAEGGSAEDGAAEARPDPEGDSTPPRPPLARGGDGPATQTQYVVRYRDTDAPGVYVLRLKRHDDTTELRTFTYNADAAESDLELASTEQIRRELGEDLRYAVHEVGEREFLKGEQAGAPIRKLLLIVLVVLLVGEQLLACRLSYHSSRTGATA